MKKDTLHMTMLFDFYSELLTEKQREYFDLYHNEDLSLSEIAEKAGISRHGVYDIVKRAEKILIETEDKTGIVAKWMNTQKDIEKVIELTQKIIENADDKTKATATGIIKILEKL